MDYTHLHLLLNHFPIIGTLIGAFILLYGVWRKNISIQEISLAIIVIMALFAIPVFLTGEPAEESVKNIPGVLESIIEEHEEAAEVAFWMMMVTGAVSLVSIALRRMHNTAGKSFILFSLILSLITFGLMARAGYLGGQIRHTEIRGDPSATTTPDQSGVDEAHEEED